MAETEHVSEAGEQQEARHESYSLNVRPLVLFGVGLALLIGVSFLLMERLFEYFGTQQAEVAAPLSPSAGERQPPPEPRLQVTPQTDFQQLRAAEDTVLNSYGWVNREAGIVRIPIDRAIELLAERGLPARGEKAGAQ